MWRPFPSPLKFWTPHTLTAGVRSAQLPRFGRHQLNHMASIPHIFSNLDATKLGRWRPFLLLFPIWTPPDSNAGVRSAHLLQSGRHTHNHTASNFAALLKLDATQLGRWRPFRTASPIWTPRQSIFGVQSTLSSPSGRLSHSQMASVLHIFSNLDATCQITWRPFLLLFPIWMPPALTAGVHSAHLLQSGRLVSQHVAYNLRFHRHLDAMQHLDAVLHLDAMLHQNSPPISPEFRKIKQATAWLSIILESGQLPSSL